MPFWLLPSLHCSSASVPVAAAYLVLVRPMRIVLPSLAVSALMIASTLAVEDVPQLPTPEMLTFMGNAESVYVFAVRSPTAPKRDDKHMRPLGKDPRDKLRSILGNPGSWYHGMLAIAEPVDQPTNIGLLFRKGRDELVLFFSSDTVEGTFRGKRLVTGMLEDGAKAHFEAWKSLYAQHELQAK
jgi:hypothetical protein